MARSRLAWPLAALALVPLALAGQETPVNNRVVFFRIMPEPMPEGVNGIALEASSQFLAGGQDELSQDRQSTARLDGEDWQLTADLAWRAGPGRFNVRFRAVNSSGGIGDQAVTEFHHLLSLPQGGRDQVPKNQLDYHLVVNGRTVATLQTPGTHLLGTDVACVVPFGDLANGARAGASVQLPTGDDRNWSTDGGVNELLGAAAWGTWGRFRLHGQLEGLHLGLPAQSAFRLAIPHRDLGRAWVGAAYQDEGPGFWRGFGLDVTVQYFQSPYRTGVPYIDKPGVQQHWVFNHRSLPRWRFGFSEDMGNFTEPDVTLFALYRP